MRKCVHKVVMLTDRKAEHFIESRLKPVGKSRPPYHAHFHSRRNKSPVSGVGFCCHSELNTVESFFASSTIRSVKKSGQSLSPALRPKASFSPAIKGSETTSHSLPSVARILPARSSQCQRVW